MLFWIIGIGIPLALLFFILAYVDKKTGKPYGINSVSIEALKDVKAYALWASKYLFVCGSITVAAMLAQLVCLFVGVIYIVMPIIIIPYAIVIVYLGIGKITLGADKFYK